MSQIMLNASRLKHNLHFLNKLFSERSIQWAVVTKLLCGHPDYLRLLIHMGVRQLCDSRLSNLKTIKSIAPDAETIYIKPPAKRLAAHIVRYADISFNTSLDVIEALSDAAGKAGKKHRIVIMVELGELREGVLPQELPEFFETIFSLPNIEVVGLGTNLTCMYGVLPGYQKLSQLQLYKRHIEKRFGKHIPMLSGGASVTIPLIFENELPSSINHFRVGETLFFGTDVYNHSTIEGMHQNVFELEAEIIELSQKPNIPFGDLGHNLTGDVLQFDQNLADESVRAIVDVGLLDIEQNHITPIDKSVRIAGASSDMTVLDLGENAAGYKVGDKINFSVNYMGALRLMHSQYIDKRITQYLSAFSGKRLNEQTDVLSA